MPLKKGTVFYLAFFVGKKQGFFIPPLFLLADKEKEVRGERKKRRPPIENF